jgi:hypothetical protein
LLGFGQRRGLVGFEEDEELRAVPLRQLAATGFNEVSGIGSQADAGQIHLWQMGGHGSFFIGVAGNGNLVHQTLVGGLKVNQREGLVGFRLLQFDGDFTYLNRFE